MNTPVSFGENLAVSLMTDEHYPPDAFAITGNTGNLDGTFKYTLIARKVKGVGGNDTAS
jgi:hypothetical protein